MNYRAYLKSEKWQEKRKAVFERALKNANCTNEYGICEVCGYIPYRKGLLQVHHKEYPEKLGEESIDTLLLCCSKCHIEQHREDKKFKESERKKIEKKERLNALRNDSVEFEVIAKIGVLSDEPIHKELCIISWNKAEPTYDLRSWGIRNGENRPLKGFTLRKSEIMALKELLNSLDIA